MSTVHNAGMHSGNSSPAQVVRDKTKGHPPFKISEEIQILLNAMPFWAILVDSGHHLIAANESAIRDLGLSREQLVGDCCPFVIHDREMPISECPLAEALESGKAVEREMFDAHRARWIRLSAFPIPMVTDDGKPIYLHFAQDITQARNTVDALSRSLEHHGALCSLLQNLQRCQHSSQILEALIDQVLSLSWLGMSTAAVGFLVKDQSLEMVVHRNLVLAQRQRCARIALGECLCGQVAQTGNEAICDSDISQHSIRYEGMTTHRHAVIPISHEGRVLGILTLYLKNGDELDDFRLSFLKAAAAASGAALAGQLGRENARRIREKSMAKMISYQEEQRKRIAWELHEQVCQSLSALLLEMQTHGSQHPAFRDIAQGCQSRVQDLIDEVRQMATQLRPAILDDYGLEMALDRYIDDLSASNEELVIDYEYVRSHQQETRLPAAVEVGLYRVSMEALSNVISHASATRASVVVLQQSSGVLLMVEDNGCGFDYPEIRKNADHCLGLIDMEERIEALGGVLGIASTPNKGTMVRAEIPIEKSS